MPPVPTGDWYIVVPTATRDRTQQSGDLHGSAQVFMVRSTQWELAAQIVLDAHPNFAAVAVAICNWFPRPA